MTSGARYTLQLSREPSHRTSTRVLETTLPPARRSHASDYSRAVEQQALQRLAHLAVDNAAGIVFVLLLLSLPPIVDQGITPVFTAEQI
jgi:hypothetical protein